MDSKTADYMLLHATQNRAYREDYISWQSEQPEGQYARKAYGYLRKIRPLFADLETEELAEAFDTIIVEVYTGSEMKKFTSATFCPYELEIDIRKRVLQRQPYITLLHELLHFYDMFTSQRKRKECFIKLRDNFYSDTNLELGLDYPDIDRFFEVYPLAVRAICGREFDAENHGPLFLLKSFELDRIRNYDKGTVFAYGMYYAEDAIFTAILLGNLEEMIDRWTKATEDQDYRSRNYAAVLSPLKKEKS